MVNNTPVHSDADPEAPRMFELAPTHSVHCPTMQRTEDMRVQNELICPICHNTLGKNCAEGKTLGCCDATIKEL